MTRAKGRSNAETMDEAMLRRFMKLPKRYSGTELRLTMTLQDEFWALEEAKFGLPVGETVVTQVTVADLEDIELFATGDIAETVIDMPGGTILTGRVQTLFEINYGDCRTGLLLLEAAVTNG